MKRILAKLKSRRGASLVFALLVFALCVLAGTAALTAASANVGRYTRIEDEQRQYFSVASALDIVQGQMDEKGTVTVTVKYTEPIPPAPGPTVYSIEYFKDASATDPISSTDLTYYQAQLVLNNVPDEWWGHLTPTVTQPTVAWTDKKYTIAPPDECKESMSTVTVDVKNGDGYALEMYLAAGDAYKIKVVWPGTVTTEMTTEETTSGGDTIRTTTLTYTLTWSSRGSVITLEND